MAGKSTVADEEAADDIERSGPSEAQRLLIQSMHRALVAPGVGAVILDDPGDERNLEGELRRTTTFCPSPRSRGTPSSRSPICRSVPCSSSSVTACRRPVSGADMGDSAVGAVPATLVDVVLPVLNEAEALPWVLGADAGGLPRSRRRQRLDRRLGRGGTSLRCRGGDRAPAGLRRGVLRRPDPRRARPRGVHGRRRQPGPAAAALGGRGGRRRQRRPRLGCPGRRTGSVAGGAPAGQSIPLLGARPPRWARICATWGRCGRRTAPRCSPSTCATVGSDGRSRWSCPRRGPGGASTRWRSPTAAEWGAPRSPGRSAARQGPCATWAGCCGEATCMCWWWRRSRCPAASRPGCALRAPRLRRPSWPRRRWPTRSRRWPGAVAGRRLLALDGRPGPWLPAGFEVFPSGGGLVSTSGWPRHGTAPRARGSRSAWTRPRSRPGSSTTACNGRGTWRHGRSRSRGRRRLVGAGPAAAWTPLCSSGCR